MSDVDVAAGCFAGHAAGCARPRHDFLQDDPAAEQPIEWALPPGELRAPVLDPVDEEQDVARFFLNDGLEDVDQAWRKKAGLLGECEQAKSEERIEALAEAC